MTAPSETEALRDADGLMARAILSGVADLLWPWREIRRLRAEVARLDYRQDAWRTAYYDVHADYTAALERLGDEAPRNPHSEAAS